MHDDSRKLADAKTTRRGSQRWLLVIAIALSAAVVGWSLFPRERVVPATAEAEPTPSADNSTSETAPVASGKADNDTIEDDGHTPWVSPTDGPPLDLSNLPSGVQIVLAARPQALLTQAEGRKTIAALGPMMHDVIHRLESRSGLALEEMDRLIVGWTHFNGVWQSMTFIRAAPGSDESKTRSRIHESNPDRRDSLWVTFEDKTFVARHDGYGPKVLELTKPMVDEFTDDHQPLLSRDMERLLADTDSDRHLTLLFRPSFLFGDGYSIFDGPMAALRGPLLWLFGDGLSAASVSGHLDDNFFVELLGVPTLDVRPERMAAELETRLDAMPGRVEGFIKELDATPHARQIVARLPAMLRILARYTRSSCDRDVVELRAYLPAEAGHNLLMGAELAVAEAGANAIGTHNRPPAEAGSPVAVGGRLGRVTSLRFARDTLETALRMLSEDVGVPIVIRGADLQSEGITKNQSFGIDLADKPAGEILVEILRLANPDKLATGPGDPRQKLVYVLGRETPGGPEVVFVTTRSRAVERGETLPAVFVRPQ